MMTPSITPGRPDVNLGPGDVQDPRAACFRASLALILEER